MNDRVAVVLEEPPHRHEVVEVMKPTPTHAGVVPAVEDVVQRPTVTRELTADTAGELVPHVHLSAHLRRDGEGLPLTTACEALTLPVNVHGACRTASRP